ncbi:MAG TPA: DUF1961 family protein [archaeon]|nr:DUF1961 family protein [archaeon]
MERPVPGILSLFFVLGLIACANQLSAKESLWQKSELLAREDFSGNLGDWLIEGDVQARIEDGRLRFEAAAETGVEKGNIWWRKHFRGPIQIEYDYQSATPYGLSMVWWHAHGRGGEDLFSYERSGVYDEYVKGRMNGYHISYHRFNSGVSNLRKSYGFHLLASNSDPIPIADLEPHHIVIYNQDNRIRFEVDGKLVHDFIDKGEGCIGGKEWLHEFPCQGTGPNFTQGKLGLRHTQKQVAYYDNFRVYRLVKP